MKILVYILLFQMIAGSVMPFSDYNQLSKIANLWEHYEEHRDGISEKDHLTLLSYLLCHFGETQHEHAEHDDDHHKNLPLQHLEAPVFSLFFPSEAYPSFEIPTWAYTQLITYSDNLLPDGHTGNVFHPPTRS